MVFFTHMKWAFYTTCTGSRSKTVFKWHKEENRLWSPLGGGSRQDRSRRERCNPWMTHLNNTEMFILVFLIPPRCHSRAGDTPPESQSSHSEWWGCLRQPDNISMLYCTHVHMYCTVHMSPIVNDEVVFVKLTISFYRMAQRTYYTFRLMS